MRVLHINTEKGLRGGERQLLLLARGLKERGHSQQVVCLEDEALYHRLAHEDIPAAGIRRTPLLGVHAPWLRHKLRRLAEAFGAGIVHVHTANAHTLATGAFLGRLPIVVTRRVDFELKQNPATQRKYTAPGQHFIAISNAVQEVLVRGGVPPGRITIVHSGINLDRPTGGDRSKLRKRWLAGREGPLIGFVGALVDHKAPWVLAEAAPLIAEELPGVRIVFLGDGESRHQIEELQHHNHELTLLAGWRDDIADCLAALDLFVMPSKEEGLCTAIAEAMAAGVPCVASRAGGIPDLVMDGETGVLVPPLDREALAKAIVDLWLDAHRRQRLTRAAEQHVHEHFTAESMIEGTLAVYRAAREEWRAAKKVATQH